MMKLCKDCKFYQKERCVSPHIPDEIDPVDGTKFLPWHKTFSNVYYQRGVDAPSGTILALLYKLLRVINREPAEICGRRAKFFEEKLVNPLIGGETLVPPSALRDALHSYVTQIPRITDINNG